MNNTTYEKLVFDFFNQKLKYDLILKKLSKVQNIPNNLNNDKKNKLKKQKYNLEKKIEEKNTFEITKDFFIIYDKDGAKKIERFNNTEINNKITDINNKKANNKSLLLKLKNEVLYELIDLELGAQKFKEADDYELYINHYEKKENELIKIKENKLKLYQEKENELRMKINETKELLKNETEANERKEYLSNYSILLKEIEYLYEEKNKFSMIEVKNDEDKTKEKIIENDLNVTNLDEEQNFEEEKETKNNS